VRRTVFLGSLIGALVVPTIAPKCTCAPLAEIDPSSIAEDIANLQEAQIGAPCPVHGYRSATIEITQHPWRWKYADA
jgi:hypothetical protein